MLRSIKSKQRKVREINLIINAAGTAISGLDSNDVNISVTDTGVGVKTLELGASGFASADMIVQVTTATADTHAEIAVTDADTIVISTFDNTDGTTAKDAIVHVTIKGSDITDRY